MKLVSSDLFGSRISLGRHYDFSFFELIQSYAFIAIADLNLVVYVFYGILMR